MEVEPALVASSRARQGQGRPNHTELELTNSSCVVRKACSCSLRSTNQSDSGYVRLPVRRDASDNWKKQLDSDIIMNILNYLIIINNINNNDRY